MEEKTTEEKAWEQKFKNKSIFQKIASYKIVFFENLGLMEKSGWLKSLNFAI